MDSISLRKQAIAKGLTALFIVLHVLFFVKQGIDPHVYTIDSYEYVFLAKNLLNEGLMYSWDLNETIEPDFYTKRPPFYAFFLILASLGTFSIWPILIVQGVISVITFYYFQHHFLIKRLEENELILFGILLASTPSFVIYPNLIMSETLLTALLILFLLSFERIHQKGGKKAVLVNALTQIALFLTKPVFYLFPILQSGFVLLKSSKNWKILRLWFVIVFGVMGFYMTLNTYLTGYVHFSSIQRIGFVSFNAFHYQIQELGLPQAHIWTDSVHAIAKANFSDDYASYNRYLMDSAISFCLEKPLNYAIFYAKGILVFFMDPGRFDVYNFMGWDVEGQDGLMTLIRTQGFSGVFEYFTKQNVLIFGLMSGVVLMNFIKLVGFLLHITRFKAFSLVDILLITLVLYVAILTGPNGASRYSLPIQFFLIYGAVKGYSAYFPNMFKSKNL